MSSVVIKPKLFCNVSKLPVGIFGNDDDPLTYIGKKIILGSSLDDCWNDFQQKYADFQKIKSITDLYQLESGPLDKFGLDCIFHPWIHGKPNNQYRDVWLSIFTDKKRFTISYNKIFHLISSIKSYGYDPSLSDDRQGGIVGYFISSHEKVSYYVNAGNHRVAALKCLDVKSVPCLFQSYANLKQRDIEKTYLENSKSSYFIRDYNTSHASCWPAVKSGFIDKKTAIKIANRYIYGY